MVQKGEHEKGVRGRFFFRGLHGSRQNYLRTYSSTLETKWSRGESSLGLYSNVFGFPSDDTNSLQLLNDERSLCDLSSVPSPMLIFQRGFIEMCRKEDSRSRLYVSHPLFAQHLKNGDLCSEWLWREPQWWLLKDCRVLPHQRRSIWSENWKQQPLKELMMEVPNKCW